MTVLYVSIILLRQILLSHQAEKTLIWGKKFLNRSFLKTMIGTFFPTCTVTAYPCSYMQLLLYKQKFVAGKEENLY